MPNTKSAIKRVKTSRKRALRNAMVKSAMKTAIKRFVSALQTGDAAQIEATYRRAVSAIDKAAQKGVIHTNQADRRKARLAKKLQAVGA